MSDLKGKKLLILGGIQLSNNIIDSCRKQGVHTIVADYLPDSPAKKNADESYLVSTTDVDAVVKLGQELQVDGIFTNYMDSMMTYCAQAAQRLGLPYYATEEQIAITTDKRRFKDCCAANGVPTVAEYAYEAGSRDFRQFTYPVIVKPVDSSGGKGISVCGSAEEFPAAYEKALSFSKQKKIIVERYMTGDEVCIYYVVQDGEISFSAMCDRNTCHEQEDVAQVPTAYIFPSKYLDMYCATADASVRRMLRAMGIQNGVVFLQAFADERQVYMYEMAFRFAGAQEYRIIRANSGYDLMDMMVRHALTGKMTGCRVAELADPHFAGAACKLTPIVRPGRIARIIGLEDVKKLPQVTDVVNVHEEGDVLDKPGTLDQLLTRIFIKAGDRNELADVIDRVYDMVHVYDEDGNEMLYGRFDTDQIRA